MAEPSDVVDRADTLMRRRRSFVATLDRRPPPDETTSAATDAGIDTTASALATTEDDDLPVLTEVVSAEAAFAEEQADRFDETRVSLLAADMAHAIGQQLTSDLPGLIESALSDAGEQLRSGIGATMESALRDFIARRRQLRLPLDEPADDA